MWPIRKRPQSDSTDDVRALADKIEDIEDGLAHVQRRFTRLQQQVTRWAREYDDGLDQEEDDILDQINERRAQHG